MKAVGRRACSNGALLHRDCHGMRPGAGWSPALRDFTSGGSIPHTLGVGPADRAPKSAAPRNALAAPQPQQEVKILERYCSVVLVSSCRD